MLEDIGKDLESILKFQKEKELWLVGPIGITSLLNVSPRSNTVLGSTNMASVF